MYFVLQTPSLQHLSVVKIVAHLWNHHDVFNLAQSFEPMPIEDLKNEAPEWKMLKDIVASKISALSLPERFVQPLVDLINPLGAEILAWCHYHNEGSDCTVIKFLDYLVSPKLCWTMRGTVNYAKTAELMVKNERVDLQKRFELACIHCLENQAREMFGRVAEKCKQKYVNILRYIRREDLVQLILFFTRSINLDVRQETMSLTEESFSTKRLFEIALCSGNRVMCEFLFHRLSRIENEQVFNECQSLIASCSQSPNANLLYYLALMNVEQQRFMFRECIFVLLLCLLRWPAQSLFVEAAQCGWQFMDDELRPSILCRIAHINRSCNDCDYAQLFWECWALSSAEYKQIFLGELSNLIRLVCACEEKFIKLVLNEAPSCQILALCNEYDAVRRVLQDENAISEAVLMECKQIALLNSSNDKEDEEKRLRSEYISRLVDMVMESRIEESECSTHK